MGGGYALLAFKTISKVRMSSYLFIIIQGKTFGGKLMNLKYSLDMLSIEDKPVTASKILPAE